MSRRHQVESGALLEGVLGNSQIPHQPLCVINDGGTFSGLPVFKDMLRRAVRRNEDITLVTVLHPPEALLPPDSSSSDRTRVIDLTGCVPGFGDDSGSSLASIKDTILSPYSGGQVFIDALDILAEDYSPSAVLSLTRSILSAIKKAKAPSRLVLLLPPSSPFHAHLIPPTFSSSLTLLTPLPPPLVEHLSRSYLSPISSVPSPNLWMILENSTKRSLGSELAYRGEQGIEVDPEWLRTGQAVVQVLVRKPTGGIKGISRSLEGVKVLPASETAESSGTKLDMVPLDQLLDINPFSTPASDAMSGERPITSHAELDLPFNLSLTEDQRRKRAEVPVPYAHEGEGASGDLIWAEEEDDDDEEI
ncbi:hypothetical protein IAU60_004414 [Kwoniella sp. DSM 27419]